MTRRLSFCIGVLAGVSLTIMAIATAVGALVDVVTEGGV